MLSPKRSAVVLIALVCLLALSAPGAAAEPTRLADAGGLVDFDAQADAQMLALAEGDNANTDRVVFVQRFQGVISRMPVPSGSIGDTPSVALRIGSDTRGRPVGVYRRCSSKSLASCGWFVWEFERQRERRLRASRRPGCRVAGADISRGRIAMKRLGRARSGCRDGLYVLPPRGRFGLVKGTTSHRLVSFAGGHLLADVFRRRFCRCEGEFVDRSQLDIFSVRGTRRRLGVGFFPSPEHPDPPRAPRGARRTVFSGVGFDGDHAYFTDDSPLERAPVDGRGGREVPTNLPDEAREGRVLAVAGGRAYYFDAATAGLFVSDPLAFAAAD